MFQFQVDMQSEALATLSRISRMPMNRLQRFAGRVISHQVKTEVYPTEWARRVSGDSGWQSFKQRMPTIGKMPGFLTGSTYSGIQVLSYDQYQSTVGVRGRWPTQYTQMPEWAKAARPSSYDVSAEYAALDNFVNEVESFMSAEEAAALARDLGVSSVGSSGEQGVVIDKGVDARGMYGRLKGRKGEYITIGPADISFGMFTSKGTFFEKRFPSEEMTAKQYGTQRKSSASYGEKKTPLVDFMYLREGDAEMVLQQIGRAVDMVLRSNVKEVSGTALIPR